MKYQIFRNYTVELLFSKLKCNFSDYSDISNIDPNVDRYIWFYLPEISFGKNQNSDELSNYLNMLKYVLGKIDNNKTIIVFTAKHLFSLNLNLRDNESMIEYYNNSLYNLSKQNKNVVVFDFEEFLSNYAVDEIVDFKYFFTSRIIINPKLTNAFNVWFVNRIAQIEGRLKKCIVLDLDNTLWGGILGEDGIGGIKIKGDYPGNVYELFQIFLLQLSKSGVILALCSKNNENDVIEAFSTNRNLILNFDNFVDWEINWNNKADNILKLAERLNIGLDSIVFIDDNPMERDLVKLKIPEIIVPDFPVDLYQFPFFLKQISNYFVTFNITSEDLNKTNQYKENQARNIEKYKHIDLDSFIKSLNIELYISKMDDFNIERLVQLTQKTNQFNLTTKRYSKEELYKLYKKGAKVFAIHIKDKFGDYGIVGLAIILFDVNFKNAELDSFLLSCRVLGKGIEHAIMDFIVQDLKRESIENLKSRYVYTNKNSQVKEFYEQFGFQVYDKIENNKEYTIKLKHFTLPKNKNYNHKINVL
jgi:FkbH-like protein